MAMPTQMQFNDMIERLEEAVRFYKETPFHFNEHELYLSNGEKLEFNFHISRIAHLLGIHIGNFQDSKILSSTRIEEMLEEIIERSIYIYQKCVKGEVKYSSLFSDFMEEKIDYFKDILQLNFDNIQFVCKYNKKYAYLLGDGCQYGCDYYIAFLNKLGQYYFLGLTYNERIHRLVPASILSPSEKKNNDELVYEIIHNQSIMLCNSGVRKNIGSVRRLPLNEKADRLSKLIEIANKNGAVLDVSSETLYLVKLVQKSISQYDGAKQIAQEIVTGMKSQKKVSDFSVAERLGEPFGQLIEVCNDRIQISGDHATTELLAELKRVRQELAEAQELVRSKDSQIETLEGQLTQRDLTIIEQEGTIASQKEQLDSAMAFQQESFQLYKKYCSKTGE